MGPRCSRAQPPKTPAVVEVDIGPGKTQRFATAKSHRQGHHPERVQAVLSGGFENAQRLGPGEATDFSVIGDRS
jgi:hypothetical protein